MNWMTIYETMISRAKSENRHKSDSGVYYESHHIIPKHMGGTNDPDNLVLLTFREHILAHYMLWRIHGKDGDRLMYLLRSNQTDESQKLRIDMAVKANRTYGKGFKLFSGDSHPMKNPEIANKVIATKRLKYGNSMCNLTDEMRSKMSKNNREIQNRPDVKQKRIDTNARIYETLTDEERYKKFSEPRIQEKNPNWGWKKGYYRVTDPNGNVTIYDSQSDIINKLGISQNFLVRNRNTGIINKVVSYLPNGDLNSGRWNGYDIQYFKNPHPKSGKIEKPHKTHKKN